MALVAISFVAYAAYGYAASVPRFLLDELYYLEAGTSLGEGRGLAFRGDDWGYGPLFPAVIAIVVRLTSDQETTVAIIRLVNAAAFAAALVPVYLLARRVVSSWSAFGVAALTAILPSTTYTALVMTESLAFLAVSWLLLAFVVTLERPTLTHQLAVVGLGAVAAGLRTQFVVLLVAWPLAIVSAALMRRAAGEPPRAYLRSFWPTAAACGLGLVWVVGNGLLGGDDPDGGSLGAYDALIQSYAPGDVMLSIIRQVGDLAIYLGVIPLVVAPIMLLRLGADRDPGRSLAAVFVSCNAVLFVTVGVFASSEFAVGRLHDRNLFALYPLWLLLFVAWLAQRLPRPRIALGVGAVLAIGSVVLLPFSEIAAEGWLQQHEAPSTEVWGVVSRVVEPVGVVIVGATLVAVLAAVLVPATRRPLLVGAVASTLAVNLALAWRSGLIDPAANGAAPRGERSWVDALVGNVQVPLLLPQTCAADPVGASGMMTLFFNRSVEESIVVGDVGVARARAAELGDRGEVLVDGRSSPLRARYVVTAPTVELSGQRLGTGSPAGLVLWETTGAVRLLDVGPPASECA